MLIVYELSLVIYFRPQLHNNSSVFAGSCLCSSCLCSGCLCSLSATLCSPQATCIPPTPNLRSPSAETLPWGMAGGQGPRARCEGGGLTTMSTPYPPSKEGMGHRLRSGRALSFKWSGWPVFQTGHPGASRMHLLLVVS